MWRAGQGPNDRSGLVGRSLTGRGRPGLARGAPGGLPGWGGASPGCRGRAKGPLGAEGQRAHRGAGRLPRALEGPFHACLQRAGLTLQEGAAALHTEHLPLQQCGMGRVCGGQGIVRFGQGGASSRAEKWGSRGTHHLSTACWGHHSSRLAAGTACGEEATWNLREPFFT